MDVKFKYTYVYRYGYFVELTMHYRPPVHACVLSMYSPSNLIPILLVANYLHELLNRLESIMHTVHTKSFEGGKFCS